MALLGHGVKRPQQLAVFGVVGFHKAADAVLAAVGAYQHLAVHGHRRHGFGVAGFGVGNLRAPKQLAGFRVKRHQLGVERAHVELVAHDGHAAVVWAAAVGGYRAHLVFVVPKLFAGHGVERVHMVVRRCDVHDPVDHDGRGLHRLQHLGLKLKRRTQFGHVAAVDLLGRVVTRLRVVHVGVQEVRTVAVGRIKLALGDGYRLRHRRAGGHGLARNLGLRNRLRRQGCEHCRH